jgi:phage shock protein PspC (stress-responsive transcriptional regulator)
MNEQNIQDRGSQAISDLATKARGLHRSRNNKVLGGVAGGLAETFGIDPTIARIILFVVAMSTGVGFLFYFGAWILLPQVNAEGVETKKAQRTGGKHLLAIAFVAIGLISVINSIGINLSSDFLWPLTLIGLGSAVLFNNGRRPSSTGSAPAANVASPFAPPAGTGSFPNSSTAYVRSATNPTPTSPFGFPNVGIGTVPNAAEYSAVREQTTDQEAALAMARAEVDAMTAHEQFWPLTSPTDRFSPSGAATPRSFSTKETRKPRHTMYARRSLGALLMFVGLVTALMYQNWVSFSSATLFASALIIVAIGLIAGSWFGRPMGFIFIGLCLTGLLMTASVFSDTWGSGTGTRQFSPLSLNELQPSYKLSAGEIDLDLSKTPFTAARTNIALNVGVGKIDVLLPRDVAVEVRAHTKGGSIVLFDKTIEGTDITTTRRVPAAVPAAVRGGSRPGAAAAVPVSVAPRTVVLNTAIGLGEIVVHRIGDATPKSSMNIRLTDRPNGQVSPAGSESIVTDAFATETIDTDAIDNRPTEESRAA